MKKGTSRKILKAFSGKEFSKKCREGKIDDSEFYLEPLPIVKTENILV